MGVHVLDVSLVALALYLTGRLVWRTSFPLPPGPPGWPLIGNLLDLRTQAPYKAVGAMSGKYGPIISLRVFGRQCIILNSFKVTKDLLEKRSAITSNRPHFTVASDLVGWNNFMGLIQYGDTHRKHRKFLGQYVRTNSGLAFYSAVEAEARQFILKLLKNPKDLIGNCRGMTASLLWKISHGYSVKDDDDPLVDLVHRVMISLSEATMPGRFLVDFFPILRHLPEWFPGGGFHRDAKHWRNMLNEAVNTPYEFVLEQLAKGDAAPSLVSRLLQKGVNTEDEDIIKWASFGMYLSGADTIPYMLFGFFLAMTMYPEILKKAQAEVEVVVGNDRLPTMEDRDMLPYVNALCRELFRWNVVIPCPTHINTQDIVYEGYFIPKGSWIFPNIWFILSDPSTYPDPEIFDPERFLGEGQQPDPREACFGWGGRACLGAHLAESTIFTYIAIALATLDVSRCVENGVERVPRYEFEEGTIRRIKSFECKIVPRSKKVEELLQVHD